MGAWGSGHFDNDAAGDWFYDVEDAGSDTEAVAVIERTLRVAAAVPGTEYLDADQGSCALAAAALVAASITGNADQLPEGVTEWLAGGHVVPVSLVEIARGAVVRTSGPQSELAELWAEAEGKPGDEDPKEWSAGVKSLLAELAAV